MATKRKIKHQQTDNKGFDKKNTTSERQTAEETTSSPPETSPEENREPGKPSAEELEKKAAEYLDSLQRLKAEFDNYRKRMDREWKRLRDVHQATVIEALLPTLDAFEAAFKPDSGGSEKDFREGIRMVFDGLMDSLKKLGLEKIEVLNRPFDPEVAEAMTVAPSSEHPPDHVIMEVASGYRFRDRVIRPAKVIVSAAVDENEGETSQEA